MPRRLGIEAWAKELEMVIEDIDSIYRNPSREMLELRRLLIEENLILSKYIETLVSRELAPSRSLGYRQVLRVAATSV